MKPSNLQTEPLEEGINLLDLSRTLLRIVARLSKNEYTEASSTENGRQVEVYHHPDLPDPASEKRTTQG